MKKSRLALVCAVMFSLLGVTHSAFATTLFGIKLDFQDDAGAYAGGGFIQFSVDPDNLPFDQPIDLNTVPVVQADMWVTGTDGGTSTDIFTLSDINPIFGDPWYTIVTVENQNPIFPVTLTSSAYDLLVIFTKSTNIHLILYGDGTYDYMDDGAGYYNHGTLQASAWFDDPIPASVVPEPAAFWLFGAGLVGLIGVARRRRV
jgi:hypothetical protein